MANNHLCGDDPAGVVPWRELGKPGKDGLTPSFILGPVTTLAAGLPATATLALIDAINQVYQVNLSIPAGLQGGDGNGTPGKDGISPLILGCTVHMIGSHEPATGSITGNQTSLTVVLNIPSAVKGDQGKDGKDGKQGEDGKDGKDGAGGIGGGAVSLSGNRYTSGGITYYSPGASGNYNHRIVNGSYRDVLSLRLTNTLGSVRWFRIVSTVGISAYPGEQANFTLTLNLNGTVWLRNTAAAWDWQAHPGAYGSQLLTQELFVELSPGQSIDISSKLFVFANDGMSDPGGLMAYVI